LAVLLCVSCVSSLVVASRWSETAFFRLNVNVFFYFNPLVRQLMRRSAVQMENSYRLGHFLCAFSPFFQVFTCSVIWSGGCRPNLMRQAPAEVILQMRKWEWPDLDILLALTAVIHFTKVFNLKETKRDAGYHSHVAKTQRQH